MAKKTFAEQIADLQATRTAKMLEMKAIGQTAVDEQRSMDTGEADNFDGLEAEIKRLDDDIGRLSRLAAMDIETAAPVIDRKGHETISNEMFRAPVQIKTVEKLDPGIAFARYAMCLTRAKGNHLMAFHLAQQHYPNSENIVKTLKAQSEGANLQALLQMKANVAAGNTTDATWAGPLVYAENFMGDFINFLRPKTLIGQAQFRNVPFNVRITGQTSGGTSGWVGQGKAKPVTKFDFNAVTVPFTKVAAIAVLTQELIRFSDPSAEMLVRDSLADCVIARVDSDLFDPDVAAVSAVNPAGLLNGVNPVVVSTITDADSVRKALLALWAPWDTTFIGLRPVYYTTPAVARNLAAMRSDLGTPEFPGMTMTGGVLDGIPVRTSNYLANNGGSGGAPFILVDESEVFLADDGSVTLDMSTEASLEMSDSPASNTGTPTMAQMVNMFQTNSVAFRAERAIWWGLRRTGAIQWIDGFPTR